MKTNNSKTKSVINVGHRGAPVVAPENTLASFKEAILAGAEEIEFDIQYSSDGEIIVFHDTDLTRVTDGKDTRILSSLSHAEIKKINLSKGRYQSEKIPTLRELFEYISAFPGIGLQIEIKHDMQQDTSICRDLCALIETCNIPNRMLITSFNSEYLKEVKAINPELSTAYLVITQPIEEILETAEKIRAEGIHFDIDLIDAHLIEKVLNRGFFVGAWRVKEDTEKMKKTLSLDIERATINDPGTFKKLRDGENKGGKP